MLRICERCRKKVPYITTSLCCDGREEPFLETEWSDENSNVTLTHSIGVKELSRIRTTVEYRRLGELHPILQIGHRNEGLVCLVWCIQ